MKRSLGRSLEEGAQPGMDLNQSIEFNSSSATSPPVHNFMPMSSFMLPHHRPVEEECQKAWNSRSMQGEKHNLQMFWNQQLLDIQNISTFKNNHQLPLARIKRIMKSGGEVKMISGDTPVLFAKACELFISELTLRSWLQTEGCKRRTLQRCDIARAIKHDPILQKFLLDSIPYDHCKADEIEKCDEEVEPLPPVEGPLPMIDINEDFVLTNHETPEESMMRPSLSSSAEFNYETGPK
ncbi:nuclear transcription factor Y subunit C-10 [Ricinus communis]|uniref:Ccaat-binding transcription factor, putative n=1 Tax=Ricinus communis TaxID=3988 RepID=B9SQ00_RICCO|nr:nuclear transcription factor Y subunit C-10 [Ricinus communis]EEF34319.1 ccaat-binding transcription factor, putative [Ricinus communis]|eukprot:XP_002528069.1 nuclear transcription factor Y subunit C-10 [Ricinus communis]